MQVCTVLYRYLLCRPYMDVTTITPIKSSNNPRDPTHQIPRQTCWDLGSFEFNDISLIDSKFREILGLCRDNMNLSDFLVDGQFTRVNRNISREFDVFICSAPITDIPTSGSGFLVAKETLLKLFTQFVVSGGPWPLAGKFNDEDDQRDLWQYDESLGDLEATYGDTVKSILPLGESGEPLDPVFRFDQD